MQWNWYAYAYFNKNRNVFYAARGSRDGMVFMHRQITGVDSEETDHRNHNTLDNRDSNLRACTRSQNQANRRKQRTNTSGYKGVSWAKTNQKWQAQTSLKGIHVHLGHYKTKTEAFNAYCEFTKEHKKDFASFN